MGQTRGTIKVQCERISHKFHKSIVVIKRSPKNMFFGGWVCGCAAAKTGQAVAHPCIRYAVAARLNPLENPLASFKGRRFLYQLVLWNNKSGFGK